MRVRSHSIGRRLKLAPWPAQATLNAIATRWSVFTLRRTSLSPRAFIQFGCGVAVGVIVTLLLSVRSIPGATMPAPSQPGSLDLGSPVVSVRPPADAPSVGAEQTVTTAGRREQDKTSAVLPSQSQSSAQGDVPSTQRAASPKLAGYRGSLAVDSAPTGARVLVNGVPVGTTPLLLKDLPVGSRVVLLELDGYERWSSAVSVVANQRVRAAVDLRRSPSNN